jgi:flagellar hook-associated protein 3 FlgL
MRITLNMQTSGVLLDINNQQENITQLSQQIASGKVLSSPSDDPYAWSQTMNISQGLQEYNSILSGISYGTGFGDATSSALNQLSDLISQAQQLAVSAQSETGSQESATLTSQVNGILQQAVSMANSQYGEQYIFGGTSTSTAPYSIDNSTGVVTYTGNTDYIEVKTSTANAASSTTAVNLTGDDVFNYTSGGNNCNVLQEIWSLGQDIQNGDSAGISSELTTLNDAYNHVNNESAVNGATLDDLTSQQSAINVMQTNEQSTLSNFDDVDVATATTKLAQAQTAYQAALQVAGILDNLDLASLLTSSTA